MRQSRFRVITRASIVRLGGLFLLLALAATIVCFAMFNMPGKSYEGPVPPLSEQQGRVRDRLHHDVVHLATTIGERNVFNPRQLDQAADWLENLLNGLNYQVERQTYHTTLTHHAVHDVPSSNIIAELPGSSRADEILIVGAHYDSVLSSPGANDNGSGVAALLELARRFADSQPTLTLHFICFVNEEPPMFQSEMMGSHVYAARARERNDNIIGMISLETIGYYSDEPHSQAYPPPVGFMYPDRGNFIGFVSNIKSRRFLREIVGAFRNEAAIPSEGGALFGGIPGVGWSDHWAFWQHGYAGVMVTDTAPFRYPHYHQPSDTPDKLDYQRMALVVDGIEAVVRHLAFEPDG